MNGRSRFFTILLVVLMLVVMVVATGCVAGSNPLKRTEDGRLEYTEGDNVWSWGKNNGAAQILFNGKLFAQVRKQQAVVSLADGRSLEVVLDRQLAPTNVRVDWGVVLTQDDYTKMATAFKVNQMAGGVRTTGPWVWVVLLLILIAAGLLLVFKTDTIVDWAKTGGLFSGFDTAKSLLILRALGVLVTLLGIILLLVVIF